jgi:signal transduction histidine kinase
MTQELLDFTSGKHRALNRQPSDISTLLEEMTTFVRQDLQTRQITLQTDFHETGTLLVDAEKMKRVFLNIITNARDAMPDGGCLTITSYLKDDMACIDFSDTGCGISPELQARMFEPMVTEGKAHGTGLGMAIVKDILDAHDAHIDVHSEIGKGTTIHIMLPIDKTVPQKMPKHLELTSKP